MTNRETDLDEFDREYTDEEIEKALAEKAARYVAETERFIAALDKLDARTTRYLRETKLFIATLGK